MLLGMALLETLERMRSGGIILNGSGEVIHLNGAALSRTAKRDGAPSSFH
jgi:hypothetical protein